MSQSESTDIRAVLFDMDGVLIDSFEMWLHVMNEAAEALGCPPIERAALSAAFGQGVQDDVDTFFAGSTREDVEAALQVTIPRHTSRVVAGPQARGELQRLRDRGLPLAIVTNTQEEAVPGLLAHTGLDGLANLVLGVTVARRAKPAPDLLLEACSLLGVDPAAALMVGDSRYDREAAAAAGTAYLHYDLRNGEDFGAALENALGLR